MTSKSLNQEVHPPKIRAFSVYVRVVCKEMGIDWARIAQQTGLQSSFINLPEKPWLFLDELTPEIQTKIEQALGITFATFQDSSRRLLQEIKWGKSE